MKQARRRARTAAAAGVLAIASLALPGAVTAAAAAPAQVSAADPYTPTWDSVSRHDPSPEWFKDAKFGVYWHWGAFSTPQYGSEWYGRYMYEPGTDIRRHHIEKYGDPATEFGYEKFITGGVDKQGNPVQFKPVLKSEGGEFDPAAWIDLVAKSGARFAGPVAEHHDGYSMWDSQVNEWNSVDMGPKLDLLKIFSDEVRKHDMKLLVAMHQAFKYNGFYMYAPAQTDPSLKKLYGQLPREQEDKLWFDKQREVIDHVQPDIIWNDFSLDSPGWCHGSPTCSVSEEQRLNYLSYYFNKGQEWNKEVVTTYKHFDGGFRNTSAVEDYERGGPADIVRPYWLTDDAISSSSWSYTDGIGYYSSKQMIHSLIDRVSKNGNMLLNISPTAAGVIPQAQQDVLMDIGAYLARNGEAVYDTRAWDIYGEGPNRTTGGSFTAPLSGDGRDIRYTRNKADDTLYATMLGWPGDGATVSLESLGASSADLSGLSRVELIGANANEYIDIDQYSQTAAGLRITLPTKPVDSSAYVLKLTFDERIPTPLRSQGAALFAGENGTGAGVSLGMGDYDTRFLTDAGVSPAETRSVRVPQGSSLRVYSGDKQTGTVKVYAAGTANIAPGSFASVRVEVDRTGPALLTSTVNGLTVRADASAMAGAGVNQRTVGGDNAESVFVIEESGGFVRLTHKASGLVIDGMGRGSGSTVALQPASGAPSQDFRFEAVGGDAVRLLNRETGLALDSGGSVPEGSPLKQWVNNGSPNLQFRLTSVRPPSVPPVVSSSPASVTVREGSPVTFSASATGVPEPTVRWQSTQQGSRGWVDVPGATDPTYEIDAATLSSTGTQYRAVFTNAAGEAATEAATLTVTENVVVTPTDPAVPPTTPAVPPANAGPGGSAPASPGVVERSASDRLASTGGPEVGGLVLAALVALVVGSAVVLPRRRKSSL